MKIMERRVDGTTGHHEYGDESQYDAWGYSRAGRYWWKYDLFFGYEVTTKPGVEPAPPPPVSPWLYAPNDHVGHLRQQGDETVPEKFAAHVLTAEERDQARVIDVYESEMQEKYPAGNYLPFAERPAGIQTRFRNFAARMEKRAPGTPIESTRL